MFGKNGFLVWGWFWIRWEASACVFGTLLSKCFVFSFGKDLATNSVGSPLCPQVELFGGLFVLCSLVPKKQLKSRLYLSTKAGFGSTEHRQAGSGATSTPGRTESNSCIWSRAMKSSTSSRGGSTRSGSRSRSRTRRAARAMATKTLVTRKRRPLLRKPLPKLLPRKLSLKLVPRGRAARRLQPQEARSSRPTTRQRQPRTSSTVPRRR